MSVDELFASAAPASGLSCAYAVGDEIRAFWFGDGVGAETPFAAGSISKPVTAFAVMALGIDLDADVNTMLVSMEIPPLDGWQPVVTPRMLLGHVAAVDGVPGKLAVTALPNVEWRYSTGGYDLLGQVIADVTRRPFDDAMRELVFQPLGMTQSRFADDLAGASLWTTATDLLRLATAINSDSAASPMLAPHPTAPRFGHGVFLDSLDGVDWWSHGGSYRGVDASSPDGAETHYDGFLASSPPFAAAALTRGTPNQLLAFQVVDTLGREHGAGQLGARPNTPESHEAWMRMTATNTRAAGSYSLPSGAALTLHTIPKPWDQNELVLTLPGQPGVELRRVTDGWWRVPGLEAYVVFDAPDAIRLVQYGEEIQAKRAIT